MLAQVRTMTTTSGPLPPAPEQLGATQSKPRVAVPLTANDIPVSKT